MTFRLTLDPKACCGFGGCVDAAPHLVSLDDTGRAELRVTETSDPAALDLADACPTCAIGVEQLDGARAA